jgi:glycosyltransferase involved in cell wall biosynthesis
VRILVATQHRGVVGGVETYLRALLPALRDAGHDVSLLTEDGEGIGSIAQRCPEIEAWDAKAFKIDDLCASLAEWRPDVVFSNGLADPSLEARLADRFPTVMYAHNYHGTCVSATKCHSRRGYRPCRRRLSAACLTVYLPFGCGGRDPFTAMRLYRVQRRRRAVLPKYRAVVTASRHMADEYLAHGVPKERIHVIPLFSTDAVQDPTPPAKRSRTDRVLLIGRLIPLKGIEMATPAVAIAAERLGRSLTLVVAGDGPGRTTIEHDAERFGVSTDILGWIDSSRRETEMRRADVLLMPSLWPEPFGLVGIEAGCVGLPTVAFGGGGVSDWLKSGSNGEAAPGDLPTVAGLADALTCALADDAHWHQLRIGAWQASASFNLNSHRDALLSRLGSAAQTHWDGRVIEERVLRD